MQIERICPHMLQQWDSQKTYCGLSWDFKHLALSGFRIQYGHHNPSFCSVMFRKPGIISGRLQFKSCSAMPSNLQ